MESDIENVINVMNLVQMEVWMEVYSSFYRIINTF